MAFIRRKNSSNELTLEELTAMSGGKIIKRYKDKIVFAKPPFKPVRKRKPTPAQADNRELLKEAVIFAKGINNDPVRKAQWKKRAKGFTNVYQAALSWYLINEPKKLKEIEKREAEQKLKRKSQA
jgi:hypothetical protein